MNPKKLLTLFLAVGMLLSSVACANGNGNNPSESAGGTNTTPSDTSTGTTDPSGTKIDRNSVSDDLPDVSFGGRDFRFIANTDSLFQLVAEDTTGIETNDVIYERNERIQERFDVKITAQEMGKETQDAISLFAMTGDHIAEVGDVWSRMGLSLAADSLCLDWMEIPYINWDKPWWNKDANADGIINGKMFNVTGEMAITAMQYTWAMAFNMDLMKDYGYTSDELYGYVLDGEWTLDKLIEVCSDIYDDKNGDGVRDPGDVYGFASWLSIGNTTPGVYGSRSMPWVQAMGEKFYTFNEDKTEAKITLGTEKMYNVLERLLNFHYNTKGARAYSQNDESDADALNGFVNGLVGIYPTTFKSCFTSFTDLGFTYGMLPYPKYDTLQERYYTVPYESYSIYQIPCTLPLEDYNMVGVIMEALNAESWKTVAVTYYDEAMKGRYSADPTTAEVIDLIMESRLFEWGYQVAIFAPSYAKIPFVFACQLRDNNVDLASTLAEWWDRAEEALELCLSFYSDEYVNPLW